MKYTLTWYALVSAACYYLLLLSPCPSLMALSLALILLAAVPRLSVVEPIAKQSALRSLD